MASETQINSALFHSGAEDTLATNVQHQTTAAATEGSPVCGSTSRLHHNSTMMSDESTSESENDTICSEVAAEERLKEHHPDIEERRSSVQKHYKNDTGHSRSSDGASGEVDGGRGSDPVSRHLTANFSSLETLPGTAHPTREAGQSQRDGCQLYPICKWSLQERISFQEREPSCEREYKCDHCSKVFNWKSNLIRHQVAHDHTRRYLCDNCNKVFTDPSNLQRHVRSQHLGARLHACLECGKTFATSSGLKQHTHIHSSVKPFRCEVCFKAYTQFSNLCRHKRMHATCRMQIKCTRCNQLFSTVTSLGKHRKYCDGASATKRDKEEFGSPTSSYRRQKILHHSVKSPSPPSPYLCPRPEIPLYSSSLFPCSTAPWTQFSVPPAGPPFITPFPSFLFPKFPSSSSYGASEVPDAQTRASHTTPKESSINLPFAKSNSEGTDTDASEEADEISSYSEDLDTEEEEEEKDPSLPTAESLPAPHVIEMFSAQRQSSPKLASVCPDTLSMGGLYTSGGLLRPMPLNCARDQDIDMPYDLSQNKNRMPAEDSPAFHSRGTEDLKSDEPLDLRVVSKKDVLPPPNDIFHKSHIFGDPEKVLEIKQPEPQESPTPSSPSPVQMAYPRPLHPMFLESMYRMQQEKLALSLLRGPDRMMPSNYPFLGPLLNTAPSFDFVRLQMDRLGKPVHDLLSTQMNKAKERYSCKFCGKVFPRSANLTRHLRTHTGEQPYKCKYCERSFSISSNLQRHVRNIHNKEKPFKCPLCDRCFGQQTNLDRHLKKHESDGPTILDDSPKRPVPDSDEKDDMYFEEIRTFIGKVTQNNQVKPGAFSDLIKSRFGTDTEVPALPNHEDERIESNLPGNGESLIRNGEYINGDTTPKRQKTEDYLSSGDSNSPESSRHQSNGNKRYHSPTGSDIHLDNERMIQLRNQMEDSSEDENKADSGEASEVSADGAKDECIEVVNTIASNEKLILNGE